MGSSGRGDASIQAFFPPTPNPSPTKSITPSTQTSDATVGDGFTAEEVKEALKPRPAEPWHPQVEYAECEIRDLYPGPRAVTSMGRIANVFDVANAPKTPKSAKGCFKLCVKDDKAAVTVSHMSCFIPRASSRVLTLIQVRLWYAVRPPILRLGSLVSIWTNHSRFASVIQQRDTNRLQSVTARTGHSRA